MGKTNEIYVSILIPCKDISLNVGLFVRQSQRINHTKQRERLSVFIVVDVALRKLRVGELINLILESNETENQSALL